MATHTITFRTVDRNNFDDIRAGIKRYETRVATEKYLHIADGDTLLFSCNAETFEKQAVSVQRYTSLDELFTAIPFTVIIPGATDVEAAKAVYLSFPEYPQLLATYGVVAIELDD